MPTPTLNPHLSFGENKNAEWYGKDILSVKQFGRDNLQYVFGVAHEMRGMVERVGTFDLLKGKILANLFFEPSTRTSSSFTAAMEQLGGSVIPINEVKYSSVSKGESLPDTVRTLECYADVIVLRHPYTGSTAIAAKAARKPVIHAGETVVIIDDLATTGGSKFEAIDVVVLVDRQSGARESLEQAGFNLHAVLTISDLLDYWEKTGEVYKDKIAETKNFLKG
jgi:hypothetical protein